MLEVLGNGRFKPRGYPKYLAVNDQIPPLVVITTNEERALPDAFIRRCLVLQLGLPEDHDALVKLLVERGKAHFGTQASDHVLLAAAKLLAEDRESIRRQGQSPPGQAEYLDIVRAVVKQEKSDEKQGELLKKVSAFALRKHVVERQR
jgi:MoxR-like ATPase